MNITGDSNSFYKKSRLKHGIKVLFKTFHDIVKDMYAVKEQGHYSEYVDKLS